MLASQSGDLEASSEINDLPADLVSECCGCGKRVPAVQTVIHAWVQMHRLSVPPGPSVVACGWPCVRKWLGHLEVNGVPTHASAN